MSAVGLSHAYWLRVVYPQVYLGVLRTMQQIHAKVAGLGGLGCDRDGLGVLGQDGGTTGFDTLTVDESGTGDFSVTDTIPVVDVSAPTEPTPTVVAPLSATDLTPVSVEAATNLPTPPDVSAGTTSSSSSPGVLSAVGNFLTSSAGISALLTVGAAAVKAAATVQAAKAQSTILGMQVARLQAGLNPAAVSYAVNPATGALTPVIATGTAGSIPLTGAQVSALTPGNASALAVSNFFSEYGLMIGAGLLLWLMLSRR